MCLLFSTQKPGYDNSNATVLNFTSFADDGKNYDERPRDAIFTGEFNLKVPAGEWLPKYLVKTPLYTRELMQDPVLVIRTPIKTEVSREPFAGRTASGDLSGYRRTDQSGFFNSAGPPALSEW